MIRDAIDCGVDDAGQRADGVRAQAECRRRRRRTDDAGSKGAGSEGVGGVQTARANGAGGMHWQRMRAMCGERTRVQG